MTSSFLEMLFILLSSTVIILFALRIILVVVFYAIMIKDCSLAYFKGQDLDKIYPIPFKNKLKNY